jgi:hypothetical protein
MTCRSQLEGVIAAALGRLSPTDLQRLAEDYARIRYPERFPRFDFRAFSEEGKSRAGWPDAWIDLGGRVDGVEATGAKEKTKVEKHLRDDLKKAKRRNPRLGGLIILSGHPAVQFDADEMDTWRKRFTDDAGIPEDRIHLIFGGGLVEELSRPEFARTRFEILGLPVTPKHFQLVLSKRGPDENRLSDFIPSDEDFASGRVHRPEIADQILSQLSHARCAFVRGVGACGKSVLAWLLALEFAEQRHPAYILDLADYIDASPDTSSALVEDLHRFSHPHVLFVVDNCHLKDTLAKEVVLAWRGLVQSQQPRLLLLEREQHTGRRSLMDGLKIEPLTFRARQAEVRGVYLRLASRNVRDPPPEPPAQVLDEWVSAFGGDPRSSNTTTDLIAFSAAVNGRMAQLRKEEWSLSPADAVDEIRSVYLDRLTPGESQNLMRLCSMATENLELGLSEESLADRRVHFDLCSRRYGLVFLAKSPTWAPRVRYRLAHTALGTLLLSAFREPTDPIALRLAIALQNPTDGVAAVGRLAAGGHLQEARQLVSTVLSRPVFLLGFESLQPLHVMLRQMRWLGLPLPATFSRKLTRGAQRRALVERALATPLHFLATFLRYTAETKGLTPVFKALAKDLADPMHRPALVKRALATQLHLLSTFLRYTAENRALVSVFKALAKDLVDPMHRPALVERALVTPLGDLPTFLRYTAENRALVSVFKALAKDLADPMHRPALVERALVTPLHFLTNFLEYTAETEPFTFVFNALVEYLAKPANRRQLVMRMERERLSAMLGALRSNVARSLWVGVFNDIDAESWAKARRAEITAATVSAFSPFLRLATQYGRPELAEAPARRLVAVPEPSEWHIPNVSLSHLYHVLWSARGAAPEEIERFLECVATGTFLDSQYQRASAGGLAGTLLGLAMMFEPDRRRRWLRESLRNRVGRELRDLRQDDTSAYRQILSLLGGAATLGVSMPTMPVKWPEISRLAEVVQSPLPSANLIVADAARTTLWLGLREMARLTAEPVLVPPLLAEPILTLWEVHESTSDLPAHVRDLNNAMINWLRQCKAAGWQLIA